MCKMQQKGENHELEPLITKNCYYLDIDLSFFCALYKYLLNLKICMLIEDGMDYSLIFLLIFL
jgi:hypothetical protein